ncbi:hypothetical protein [Pseudomonas amygdali]|uniref:Uncharacterized protein n=2 Tax=Pseudomonas amygdali pv. lachrymans TaxID=53707 RepID=A0ABR5KTN1_PSEAV|nr:hypothetical protein [Pseudomonas amygdali]AXH59563.1 hypothetical protein PLA107_030525 [Pseudomonas amygdali pv. lachrymans str. M301315]KPC16989.1 Uncharacterized protein AC499_0191 [Pseudomonas amygdali pv. lachrymans]KPC17948.1 Uncharacterized protein AC499_1150 [Pseudomonas amygdali pv. lachrymans]
MFPNHEIESFYRSYKDGYFLKDEFLDVASLCEEWLLGFDDKEPVKQALSILALQPSDYKNDDRLHVAMSMALCIPSEKTGTLIPRYSTYIENESFALGSIIAELNKCLPPHGKVDVLRAISALPGREYYQAARLAYMVSMTEIRNAALVEDNLEVFKNTLTGEAPKRDMNLAMEALASFPENQSSEIHQALIHDDQGGKDLFFQRVKRLRQKYLGEYTEEWGWLRPAPGSAAILQPYESPALPIATFNEIPPAHLDPQFSIRLGDDKQRLVDSFFYVQSAYLEEHDKDVQGFLEAAKAFMAAGVSGAYIIDHAVVGKAEGSPPATLMEALEAFGRMNPINQAIFAPVYTDYLSQFTDREIIAQCESDGALAAVYGLTRKKAFLLESRGSAIDRCLSSDLGL